jgi:hypothetical protein
MSDKPETTTSERVIELKKLELLERDHHLKRWANPLSVAIVTALIAFGGNWIATTITSRQMDAKLALERLKFEYQSLGESFAAYAAGDEAQSIKMLHFYSELGLIESNRNNSVRKFISDWAQNHGVTVDEIAKLNVVELGKRIGSPVDSFSLTNRQQRWNGNNAK